MAEDRQMDTETSRLAGYSLALAETWMQEDCRQDELDEGTEPLPPYQNPRQVYHPKVHRDIILCHRLDYQHLNRL